MSREPARGGRRHHLEDRPDDVPTHGRRPGDHRTGPDEAAKNCGRDTPAIGARAAADPGGPVVAACTGSRCAALCRLTGTGSTEDPLGPDLREAVRHTRGAVLISTGCLGRCELGALILLTWRHRSPAPVALAGMHQPDRRAALASWLPGKGPRQALFERRIAAGELAEAMTEAAAPPLAPPTD